MDASIIGAGLVGSHVARILVEPGERSVLMDRMMQSHAVAAIVDLANVTLVEGDVLQPLAFTRVLREHRVGEVVRTVPSRAPHLSSAACFSGLPPKKVPEASPPGLLR